MLSARYRGQASGVLLILAIFFSTPAYAQEPVFQAGAFAIDITPTEFPIDSAGSMGPRKAELAHDPLFARCLVLSDGETKIAIVVCDSCMIPRQLLDAAKTMASQQTGIPTKNILCSATHTHTAVTVTPTFQSVAEVDYGRLLAKKIAEGIARAHKNLAPAHVGWAVGNNPRQVFNRRWHMRAGFPLADPFDKNTDKVRMNPPSANSKLLKPAGPIDPEIPILSIRSPEGTPIALLANYSLHYVGGVPPKALSGDYFGEFARQIARLTEAPDSFVGMMSNGTSADINNINFFEGRAGRQPFEQIRYVAADVASSTLAAYKRVEYRNHVRIKMAQTEVELGVRRPSKQELERARAIIEEAGEGPYSDRRAIYALESIQLAEYPATVKVKLQAIRIGGLGIVSSPCETFVETGLAIKRQSPLKPTFTIELANGYNGYLPTPEQHALGGYETWRAKSSYLARDAEPKVRAALLELLKQVSHD